MSLILTVDGDRWRAHLRRTAETHPSLVPVCKGNGYGLGLPRLARKAAWLGVDTVAVGTYDELPAVASRNDCDLVVMHPWRPFGAALDVDDSLRRRVIHTVSREADLVGLLERQPDARFVLERMTSMRRHGLSALELWSLGEVLAGHPTARLEGVSLHLPLANGSHLAEVERLLNDVVAARLRSRTLWVSHLTDAELAALASAYPDYTVRPRIGTALWLGDRDALQVSAEVLDVHPVERGDSFGYRARQAPRSGHLLIVSGGTAHGIGLEAPSGDAGLRSRVGSLARGGMDAAGFVRSPFSVDGKQRLFAEPPHMQASMLFLPAGAHVPAVGDRVDVRVRFTATDVDRVEFA